MPKYPTQEEQELDNDYYEEVPTRPRITTTLPMRHHYMVDNLSSAGTCTSPSNTYVKMNATHVTGTLNRDYPNTRDMSKPMPPPKPLSLKSPLRSQQAIENDGKSMNLTWETPNFNSKKLSCSWMGRISSAVVRKNDVKIMFFSLLK